MSVQRRPARLITRRRFLATLGGAAAGSLAFAGYAFGVEPRRLHLQHYALTPPRWPSGLRLRIAALADIHACEPWMNIERLEQIVAETNALGADLIVLLGDYAAAHRWVTRIMDPAEWAPVLAQLRAPLGVHAILGNHDWWDDGTAQRTGSGPVLGHVALERVGIRVYENQAVRLQKHGFPFWLAGLGDQIALLPRKRWGRTRFQGVDDLPGTLAMVTDDAPVILLAHEPDIFPRVPERVSLTLSGHTHGGQVRIFGYSPVVPSRYGNRYAYGHVVETDTGGTRTPRHLIVSGGLGCSIAPIRFGVPPEILLLELGASNRSGSV